MSIFDFSFRRPIGSYSKVQKLVARWKRNRRSQLQSSRVLGKEYLDVGCGPNAHLGFINLEYSWHPGIDLCWDITKGIPLAEGSMKGVFSEHCMEHFSLPMSRFLLSEFHRVLKPGGTVRIAVPDAGKYLNIYMRRITGQSTETFPYEEVDRGLGLKSPLVSVNRIFYLDRDSPAGHRCMYDYPLLAEMLAAAGFRDIGQQTFRKGRDPKLLIDMESREVESLYVEATA